MKARLADIRSAGEHEFVYSLTKDSKAWLGKLSKIMLIVSKSSDQMSWVLSGQISQPSLYLKCEIQKSFWGAKYFLCSNINAREHSERPIFDIFD